MIGAEWNYIERKRLDLIGGPKENHKSLEEVIVQDCKGNIYALKDVFDDNEHLLSGYKLPLEEGKNCFEMEVSQRNYANYYPSDGFPEDSVLVVRTEALREFEQHISDDKPETNVMIFSTSDKPESSHDKSSKLRTLNQASLIFWSSKIDRDDKTTWPDTKSIIAFLEGKDFTNSLAKRGASIIRPDWAESGARPKE